MNDKNRIAAADDLFTMDIEEPRLIGGKCPECGTFFFPRFRENHKPNCKCRESETVLMSRQGTLASYTVQYYCPPPPFVAPEHFEPYAIGMISFPEGINVLGILVDIDIQNIQIGLEVEVILDTLFWDDAGNDVVGWKFRPVAKKSKNDSHRILQKEGTIL